MNAAESELQRGYDYKLLDKSLRLHIIITICLFVMFLT